MPVIIGQVAEDTSIQNTNVKFTITGTHHPKTRVMGFTAGLVLSEPLVYDTKNTINFKSAINKNLAPQVTAGVSSIDKQQLQSHIQNYVSLESTIGIDAMQPKARPTDLYWTKQQVIDHTRAKGLAKKAQKYENAVPKGEAKDHHLSTKPKFDGSHFIKLEALKPGKDPRLIFDASTPDVLNGRVVNSAYENWMHRYPTVKGLATNLKFKPVQDIHEQLGCDTWVLALDDTARDANTVRHDFDCYGKLLDAIGINTDMFRAVLSRAGFTSHYSVGMREIARVSSQSTSLLSGCDFTSSMNYNTTRFNAYYLCTVKLGLARQDWGVVAEGDDCLILIRKSAMPDFMTRLTEEYIKVTGEELCKRWKIEGLGSYDKDGGHPFVGGTVVYSLNRWWFFPSVARMRLKATTVLRPDSDEHTYRARLAARSEALRDRFTAVPLGWTIARFVTYLSAKHPAREPLRTAEEEYQHKLHVNQSFVKYDDDSLHAFWKATGISPADVLEFERLVDDAISSNIEVLDVRHITSKWC